MCMLPIFVIKLRNLKQNIVQRTLRISAAAVSVGLVF